VASICARLDGIPLAIELAAPWVQLLSPRELLQRLDQRLELLTARRRDLPPRHRTMLATVEWSHRLLPAPQQVLFRRLAVFEGTFGLDAAEEVCGFEPLGPGRIGGLLAGLLERSMAMANRSQDGATRYRLLETLRDFGADRLRRSGELSGLRRRHFLHYLGRAERIDARRLRFGEDAEVATLAPDADNFHAALGWSFDEDPAGALRLASALEGFWMMRSVAEGRAWRCSRPTVAVTAGEPATLGSVGTLRGGRPGK
jgi:predicted ATPase